jgi:type IV pilus assembly protein PilM
MADILLGIDIGNNSIKAVQVSKDKDKTYLLAAGYIPTTLNSISLINNNEKQVLANSINRLIHDMKVTTTNVSASLPSSKVITRVIQIPIISDKELISSIQWEAEQFIPWQLSNVKLDYVILSKDESRGKMKVLLVAAPISLIEKYMEIISMAGLTPVSLEPEVLSISRIASFSFQNISNFIALSIGATTSEISLLHDKSLIYTKSIPIGGITITRVIVDELGFDLGQAEEYKKTYGLDEDKLEGKLAKIITPLFTSLLEEMEKISAYFKEESPKEELHTVVLAGGTSRLPELITYITKQTGFDSQIINPFITLSIDPNIIPIIMPDAPIYTTAVGLAVKDIEE